MRLQAERGGRATLAVRLGPIAISSGLLGLLLLEDVQTLRDSLLMKELGFAVVAVSAVITLGGVVVPLIPFLWLASVRGKDLDNRGSPTVIRLADRVLRCIGFLFVILPICVFYLFESFLPFSVIPLSIVICGLAWLTDGYFWMRRSGYEGRITLLATGLLVIITMRFVDWNKQKPFFRDLIQVKLGMTVSQFEARMGRHEGLRWLPDSDPGIMDNKTLVYRLGNDLGLLTVELKDDKVEAVGIMWD